jgi:hypothetical protein
MRITAIILVLLSDRARRAGPLFLAGYILSLSAVTAIGLLLSNPVDFGKPNNPSTAATVLLTALSLLILGIASWVWTNRPLPGTEPELPHWLHSVVSLPPILAFGLGIVLSVVSFKNLGLIISAVVLITQADPSATGEILLFLTFVIVGSLGVGVPVIWYFRAGADAPATLERWKTWLTVNNAKIMSGSLAFFGLLLLARSFAHWFD